MASTMSTAILKTSTNTGTILMSNLAHEALSAPKGGAFDVTPSDTVDLTIGATALYVGNGGDIKVDTSLGDTVTFIGVGTGAILPVRVRRVYATGTSATSLVGLY